MGKSMSAPDYKDMPTTLSDGATFRNLDTGEYMIYNAVKTKWDVVTEEEAKASGKFVGSWTSGVRKKKK